MQASRSMGPSPHSTLVRSSSQEHPDDAAAAAAAGGMAKSRSSSGRGGRPKTVPHTQSMGSEESSILSDKVINPTETLWKLSKRLKGSLEILSETIK